MKHIYLIAIISLLNLNFINAQTITIDDHTLGAVATYTFTYVTSNDIGVGTSTPNIFYLSKPSGYANFAAVNPLPSFAPNVIIKVNGTEMPINSINFGTVYGSWTTGVQISTSGASGGSVILAGATIEVTISNIITNPVGGGSHTFNWKTSQGTGTTTEAFSYTIDFSTLSVENPNINNKHITIHPNPSSDFITVSNLNKEENFVIYNTLGAIIKKGRIANKEKLNIQNLNNGIYLLKLENGTTFKFIKD